MAGVDFEKAVRRLRDELSSSIGGERYKRVSPSLRAQVVAVARSAHEGGWSWSAIGESLGIASKKVQRWCTEDVGGPAWMPVEIGLSGDVEAVKKFRFPALLPRLHRSDADQASSKLIRGDIRDHGEGVPMRGDRARARRF